MRTLSNPRLPLVFALCLLQVIAIGCRSRSAGEFRACGTDDCYRALATQIEYPQVKQCCDTSEDWANVEPLSLTSTTDPEYWDVELEEVVQLALSQSKVLRDLGGAILQSPSSAQTYWNPALQETDPLFGIDAALSAFDAEFSTSVFGEKNDRAINNSFFGGGTRLLNQDLLVVQSQLTKRAVTGSEFTFRHNVEYDANNAPSNLFASAWNVNLESEFRHPLLQGSGMQFNRIAGPSKTPGLYGGVLIARVNTDIELAEFEMAVRDLVSGIENAYWELYFSYRDLDAKIAARDEALKTWRGIHALFKAGRQGGEAEKEAQAREQFFRFQEEVQNSLSGRLTDVARTGSSGGGLRANGGVHLAERHLRRIVGLPPSDGRLLRPSAEPVSASVHFDWKQVTSETLVRRAELRRQRFETRRRELEWIASKNHLLPRFDAIGRYRWRGFGDDLLDTSSNNPPFDNAYEDLTGGDFQEWQLGFELSVPIGYRRAFSAARNAELQLCRSRAILREQEHQVLHDVSAAVAEMQRAYVILQTSFNRFDAARTRHAASDAAFEAGKSTLDLLLDAQRQLATTQSSYFRALAEHAIAIKNVHFVKGTLLDYDGVYLSEGGWPQAAHQDARRRESRRGRPLPLNYASSRASRVSHGPYDQRPDQGLSFEISAPDAAGVSTADIDSAENQIAEPPQKVLPAIGNWTPENPSVPLATRSPNDNPANVQVGLGTASQQDTNAVDSTVQAATHIESELIMLPAPDDE